MNADGREFNPGAGDYRFMGWRAYQHREDLRQIPVAIGAVVGVLRKDLVAKTLVDQETLSDFDRDGMLALIEVATRELYNSTAALVGEDDTDLRRTIEQFGGEV